MFYTRVCQCLLRLHCQNSTMNVFQLYVSWFQLEMTTVFTHSSKKHDHFILQGRSSICFNSYINAFVAVVTIGTIILRFCNSAFCPYSVLMVHSVLTINSDYFLLHFLTFIMDIQFVFCVAETALWLYLMRFSTQCRKYKYCIQNQWLMGCSSTRLPCNFGGSSHFW